MMTDQEESFLRRVLFMCGKAPSTKEVRFGDSEDAFNFLYGAGGMKARMPYTATESIEYVELQVGHVKLSAQITVESTEQERAIIASEVRS